MPTYKLPRFSDPDALKRISPERLLELLDPHRAFFLDRDLLLPSRGGDGAVDYRRLVDILMSPDEDMPNVLANSLYFIHEMATPEAMDSLLDRARELDDLGSDPTPADVAVLVGLRDPEYLERMHAETFLGAKRSFESYLRATLDGTGDSQPRLDSIPALEQALDDFFEKYLRGRGCRVFAYPRGDEVWFLVRHGEPYRREGRLVDGKSDSVFFRPEKHDVLVYSPVVGELRLTAGTKREKDKYLEAFGKHLFSDSEMFTGTERFTLEPLRRDGKAALECSDVEGLEEIVLKEIHYSWGGKNREIEIRKAKDLFAALKARGRKIRSEPKLLRASFQVRFTDSKSPRSVSIRLPNVAQYTRDSDGELIEQWLGLRGFLVGSPEAQS